MAEPSLMTLVVLGADLPVYLTMSLVFSVDLFVANRISPLLVNMEVAIGANSYLKTGCLLTNDASHLDKSGWCLARAGVTIIAEKIREARLIWFGYLERKTGKDVAMRTWKKEVGGHRKIERPKRSWIDAPTPNRENVEEEVSYTFLILLGCVSL